MCKNADRPCPGCQRHNGKDADWLFLIEEERQAVEGERKTLQARVPRT